MSEHHHRGIGMTSERTRERLIQRLRDEGIKSNAVLNSIRGVPRHIFVEEALASRAYEDTALPIGHGQTISQPYIVAYMTVGFTMETLPIKIFNALRYGYTPTMASVSVLFVAVAAVIFGLIAKFGDLPKLLGNLSGDDT